MGKKPVLENEMKCNLMGLAERLLGDLEPKLEM